jgi:beta-ureidopropionase
MPRLVRIATIAAGGEGGPTPSANRERMARKIERAMAHRPDILALPESFTLANLQDPNPEEMAEDLDGPTLRMAADYARAHRAYILCPILARRPDGTHIEAFLLDRQGSILGSYQKHHPVVEGWRYDQVEFGSLPGTHTPVFQTDFGRIGVQICFDVEYPDGWEALDRAGAEIFFWLSAYDGGRDLVAKAWQYHRFLASAVQTRFARILDPMGDTLSITGAHEDIAFAAVDLDTALFHMDFNKTQIQPMRAQYGPDVAIQVYNEEGYFTLRSNRPDLSVAQLIAEFHLDPLQDYLARVAQLEDALRAGQALPTLTPPYTNRQQWV